jgi:ABC-type molybdenum transport system ATPase subunit/photorepair protein PhrA
MVFMQRTKSTDARYVETRLAHIHLERGGRTILSGVNWTIRPGERWVLAGGAMALEKRSY